MIDVALCRVGQHSQCSIHSIQSTHSPVFAHCKGLGWESRELLVNKMASLIGGQFAGRLKRNACRVGVCASECDYLRVCVQVCECASVCVRLCHFNLKSFACIVHFLMCGKLFFSSCMRCSPSRRFNECPNWTCPPSAPSCLSLLLPLDAWCWRWRWLWQLAHLSVVSALWSGFALTNWYVMSRNNFGRSADGIVPDSSPERQSPLRHCEVVVDVAVAANRRRRRRR